MKQPYRKICSGKIWVFLDSKIDKYLTNLSMESWECLLVPIADEVYLMIFLLTVNFPCRIELQKNYKLLRILNLTVEYSHKPYKQRRFLCSFSIGLNNWSFSIAKICV